MISFKNISKFYIKEAIDSDDTTILLNIGDYPGILNMGGDYAYFVLIDTLGKEIVKVDIAASSQTGIVVSRGQGGTAARAWARGSLFFQSVTEAFLNDVRQEGAFRSIDYNPNGILTPAYANESVYQSDLALWWKSIGVTTVWELVAGVVTVATPVLSPAAGTHDNGQACTITCTTSGANIYYTTDGSTPDENSTLYSGAFSLPDDSTTTVKAIAIHSAKWWTDSAVAEADYLTEYNGDFVVGLNSSSADLTVFKIVPTEAVLHSTIEIADAYYLPGGGLWQHAFDGTYLWVWAATAKKLFKVNLATGEIIYQKTFAYSVTELMYFAGFLWFLRRDNETLEKINPVTWAVDDTIDIGESLLTWIDFDGTYGWVSNFDGNDIIKLDIAGMSKVATINLGDYTNRGIWAGGYLFVGGYPDTIMQVNTTTGAIVRTITLSGAPHGMATDGTHVWAGLPTVDKVAKITIADGTVIEISVGDQPWWVACSDDHVWASNNDDDTVSKINKVTNIVEAVINTGIEPYRILFTGKPLTAMGPSYWTLGDAGTWDGSKYTSGGTL